MKEYRGHKIYSDHQELIWYYKEKKNIALEDKKWAELYFRQYTSDASELMKLCDNELAKAKARIDITQASSEGKKEHWNLKTVLWQYKKEIADMEIKKKNEAALNPSADDQERMRKYLAECGNPRLRQIVEQQLGVV